MIRNLEKHLINGVTHALEIKRMVVIVVADLIKLESSTEIVFVKWVSMQNCDAIKVNKRSWPDRLVVLNWGYSFYIEFKREGKADKFGKRKGEKFQKHTHNELRKRGVHVYLVDDIHQAKEVFRYELARSNSIMTMLKPFRELKI